ncbi:hypothetical protein AvCA_37640 [Azotobacter vinelandii CA]|uniref:Uncharacterized protein n=2 Tax=Azotobacter vinelandii TaxID=354 RepID=C1DS33_AZOVD|nr:hypothetical protein Avin_37640 [Azotobacter vinelandii DJ]AGK16166.1 hypothetical protein AvCA_37640 [Azotobacter vinelandii CA]AGK21585.1 hypothetical protein AvCA6_37640 [Azotobacter vinelandii CA6]
MLAALLVWLLSRETDALRAELKLATESAEQAMRLADRRQADIEHLNAALGSERSVQERLRREQGDLHTLLAGHQRQLEALRDENRRLRDWAAKFLPAAQRPGEQPAPGDADAYDEGLSGNSARPATAVDSAGH